MASNTITIQFQGDVFLVDPVVADGFNLKNGDTVADGKLLDKILYFTTLQLESSRILIGYYCAN